MTKKKDFVEKEEKALRKEWKNIIFDLAFAVVALLITVLFYRNITLTTILLAVVSIVGFMRWKSWLSFCVFLFAGIFAPFAESFAISYGVWEYSLPSVMNIPLWLFVLCGIAGVFLFEISKEIHRLGVKDG